MKLGRIAALLYWLACCALQAAVTPAEQHFIDRVKPLLDSRCVSCHGPDKQKANLRMDSRAALLKGGDNGPAIVPGKPAESLLVQAVMHAKPDLEMPPKERLTPKDIAVLEQWIRDGAVWPEITLAAQAQPLAPGERLGDAWTDPRNPIVKIFGGQRLDLWSLKPVQNPAPPKVRGKSWVRNPIDRFVLARLEVAGLHPLAEADRRILARRLYFDLTGLPPTPEEMNAFLADRHSGAYERLVDRLLDSPRYGEHWARQWLDVIRYSDSNGFDWDEFRPRAWRFRDYVIRSLNNDKPFDRFIREQIAGDELLDGPPQNAGEQDDLIATGYLRLGPHDNSAPLFGEQARSRAELMADLVDTTGSAFLGLSLACCRCHDHKYDPLSQADHFRMRAFFEPVKFADQTPLDLAADQAAIRKHNQLLDEKIHPLQAQSDSLLKAVKDKLRAERIAELPAQEREWLALDKQTKETNAKAKEIEKKVHVDDNEAIAKLSAEEKARHEKLAKQIEDLKKQKREFTHGLLMTDAEGQPPVTHILFQGDYKQERDTVAPGFISALDPNPANIQKGKNQKTSGRRLALANWITSPENPLTARVIVNRVWQSHFGRGLVATPNDFGLAGARPTHPELLDWLASEFIREGWSLKKLHRLIVTSATYRELSARGTDNLAFPSTVQRQMLPYRAGKTAMGSSVSNSQKPKSTQEIDAEDNLLWRQNLRRLSAEQLRDSVLAVSGLLQERQGGPPVWPELPPEVLQANPAFLDDNPEKTKGWYPSPKEERNVRSVYLVQKRTVRVPFLETFDLPENATSCPRRNQSTVAPQALSLMNGSLTIEAARSFAARVQNDVGSDPQKQIERAFALAFQRMPDAEETNLCRTLVSEHSLTELCRALLNLNEFIYVD